MPPCDIEEERLKWSDACLGHATQLGSEGTELNLGYAFPPHAVCMLFEIGLFGV